MRRLALCLATSLSVPALASDLTLHRVVLSAAGVGYFEYDAEVSGEATLGLAVPIAQVDDVLRSLVVFDAHGEAGGIDLRSPDGSSAIDAAMRGALGSSLVDILTNLRGEEVVVDGPQPLQGRLAGVSAGSDVPAATDADNPPAVARTRVTLLTGDGFRQFILEDTKTIRFTDSALRDRIDRAMDGIGLSAAAPVRHLTLTSLGDGDRQIRVGYMAAAPMWKASYRVVLPARPEDKARLQGWAVLENETASDWNRIDLTLHAGNPVTLHQAIYNVLFADRPEVPVDTAQRLLPEVDTHQFDTAVVNERQRLQQQGSAGESYGHRAAASSFAGAASAGAGSRMDTLAANPMMHRHRYGNVANEAPPPDMAPPPPQAYVPPPEAYVPPQGSAEGLVFGAAASPNVNTLAESGQQTTPEETAVDTTFHIAPPLTLQAGHTASVPIIDKQMALKQVDLLPAGSNHPVMAMRLTNDGTISLPPGVVTFYQPAGAEDGVAFAGDGRLGGLPAGESRLVAFAEDLRLAVKRETGTATRRHAQVTAGHCYLTVTDRIRQPETVTLSAPPHEARHVIVEFHKWDTGTFGVVDQPDKKWDETATAWRVPVDLAEGETKHLTAYREYDATPMSEQMFTDENNRLAPDSLNTEVITGILQDKDLDPALRAQLSALLDLNTAYADRRTALKAITDKRQALEHDETRVRDNLRVNGLTGEMQSRFMAELQKDEATLSETVAQESAAEKARDNALTTLRSAACGLTL